MKFPPDANGFDFARQLDGVLFTVPRSACAPAGTLKPSDRSGSTLERDLRRELDDTTKALAEALDLFDGNWCPEHGHAPQPEVFARVVELRKWLNGSEQRAASLLRDDVCPHDEATDQRGSPRVIIPFSLVTEGPTRAGVNGAAPLQRDRKLRMLLDAARELAAVAGSGPQFRVNALDALETAALAWTVEECSICGRRGDHEWEELTHTERTAHEAEAAAQGI